MLKNRKDFSVPLSRQARAIVAELRAATGDNRRYLFSLDDKPMPSEYLNRALRAGAMIPSIGIAPTVFVSTASTSLNESKLFRPEVIERQLAHVKKDKVESRYNRAQYRSEREPTDAALGR